MVGGVFQGHWFCPPGCIVFSTLLFNLTLSVNNRLTQTKGSTEQILIVLLLSTEQILIVLLFDQCITDVVWNKMSSKKHVTTNISNLRSQRHYFSYKIFKKNKLNCMYYND